MGQAGLDRAGSERILSRVLLARLAERRILIRQRDTHKATASQNEAKGAIKESLQRKFATATTVSQPQVKSDM
jgi:hypothetical protein